MNFMKSLITTIGFILLFSTMSFSEGVKISADSHFIVKGDSVVTATFSISNLGCSSDAANMEKAILQAKGVKDCTVDAGKGTAVIKYSAKKTSKEELTLLIQDCSLCHDKSAKPFKVTSVK